MAVGPASPNLAMRSALEKLDIHTLAGPHAVRDADLAWCCVSALWLLHDFLDESHAISQRVSTPSGSYWHGMMHRREPDYGNAKYWFRQVGTHAVHVPLRRKAATLADSKPAVREASVLREQSQWDALKFVDLCHLAAESGGELEVLCREVAQREWELLFDFCYRGALDIPA